MMSIARAQLGELVIGCAKRRSITDHKALSRAGDSLCPLKLTRLLRARNRDYC